MTKLYIDKNQNGILHFKDSEMTIRHRDDGPAVEWFNGDKKWYQNNKFHRLDGPALEYANGTKKYYYQDEYFPNIQTNEQWEIEVKIQNKFKKFI